MNRNESDRQGVLCFLIKNRKTLKTIFIACKKSYDKAVVETQVLGVKPPQICKKTKEKCPKVWGMQKQNIKEKKGNKKNCINPGNNFHIKYHNNNNGK